MNSLVAIVVLALTCTAAGPQREPTPATAKKTEGGPVTLRLQVPQDVAGHAAARVRGDASSPPPILVLRNLVIGAGEGFTLEVFGPDGERLAVSGLLGERQAALAQPVERMTLVVPLNDEGSRLVSGRKEVALTLQLSDSPGRPALQFERAYFQSGTAR
jgi:hypothetical protein